MDRKSLLLKGTIDLAQVVQYLSRKIDCVEQLSNTIKKNLGQETNCWIYLRSVSNVLLTLSNISEIL